MRAVASAGLGFLAAVLWFDLMFDVQVRVHAGDELPANVLDSIAAYYARVTTAARPMNRLIALVMLITVGALVAVIILGDLPAAQSGSSLVLAAGAIGIAGARTVRNAVRLGTQVDSRTEQTRLARLIFRDHVACLVAIAAALVLQIA